MPRRPYLPPGTLRDVLAYPQDVENFEPRTFTDALARVGLSRLTPMLDRASRWDQELNGDDQQGVMLARLLMHRPRWVVLDDLLDAIDGKTRSRAFEIFASDLKDTAIVHIGRADTADPSFTRVVRIVKDPNIRRMVRARLADATSSPPGTHAAAAS
jgi:putative ATP-binding cassette transporter